MRWPAVAAVAACLTLAASAGAGHDLVALTYPTEQVTCGAVAPHVQLRWHDEQLLDTRARALGLRTEDAVLTVAVANFGGRTTSPPNSAFRARSVDVVADVSPKLRGVCTAGPGQPTVPLRLVDDVTNYGTQPLTTAAASGVGEVEHFIASHYAASDLKCDLPRNSHGPGTSFFCFTSARAFYAQIDSRNRTFVVTPQPRRR
jgi:hypothetical protein